MVSFSFESVHGFYEFYEQLSITLTELEQEVEFPARQKGAPSNLISVPLHVVLYGIAIREGAWVEGLECT